VQTRCQALCRDFFSATDCVRLATAASELARNIYMYAREGEVRLELREDDRGVLFTVLATDRGPGIANVAEVLSGRYVSRTGLGRGLSGARKLLDDLEVDSAPGKGTTVRGWKRSRSAR
jgi:serine/threonine-protein kinase RsbT